MSETGAAARAATRVLVVTDLVDSTRLAADLGDEAIARFWSRHDRMARDLVVQCKGQEIDKTDGMLLLFESVADAADYAAAYHRALAQLPSAPGARVGVHLAEVFLRENDAADVARGAKPLEVEGIAKSVAARVMSVGEGGATLFTPPAAAALQQAGQALASLGHWMLKGVPQPIELFAPADGAAAGRPPHDSAKAWQVVQQGARWVPTSQLPHNLPPASSALYGRDSELDALREACARSRLVTLTGMGGMGKTQLALQLARELRAQFPDGTWFVDLQAIRDPEHVAVEMANVLGVRAEAGRPLLQTLGTHLRSRQVLLVLDNCEQVIEACAQAVGALLQAAAQLRFVATSREPLNVPGEACFPVSPLPLPDASAEANADAVLGSPAVQLFLARSGEQGAAAPAQQDVPQLARLASLLEGIPLAIELAAARSRSMPLAEINRHLEKQRYALLTRGKRTLSARQQTLRGLLDWSYELLDEAQQRDFALLGVFVGGFDLAGAQAVLAQDELAAADSLASLVEKSLLAHDETEGEGRYRMLETVREYAAERLAAGESLDIARERHCRHFAALASSSNRAMQQGGVTRVVQKLELELDNLRAALAYTLDKPYDPVVSVRMGVALQGFWLSKGHVSEGLAHMRAAMELPAIRESQVGRAFALYVCAVLVGAQGKLAESIRLLEESLEIRRALGQVTDIAASLSTQAHFRIQAGDAARARVLEQEALDLFTASKDRFGQAISLEHLGQAALLTGDLQEAEQRIVQTLAIAQEIGNPELEAEAELLLGSIGLDADGEGARRRFERALEVSEAADLANVAASSHRCLGKLSALQGDAAQALSHLRRATQTFLQFGVPDELLLCMEEAVPALQPSLAAAVAGAAANARARIGVVRYAGDEARWRARLQSLRTQLGDAEFEAQWARGGEWSMEAAAQAVCDAAAA